MTTHKGALALDTTPAVSIPLAQRANFTTAEVMEVFDRISLLKAELDSAVRDTVLCAESNRKIAAERDRLRAALDEIAGDLRGRCEPGTTAMHVYNVATKVLAECGGGR